MMRPFRMSRPGNTITFFGEPPSAILGAPGAQWRSEELATAISSRFSVFPIRSAAGLQQTTTSSGVLNGSQLVPAHIGAYLTLF